jgi:hypothetical protein
MIFRRRDNKPKSKYSVGQDVMDSQDMPIGQVVSVHEDYLEIADGGSGSATKSIYVPLNFISPIPRGSGIALTVAKAQIGIKSWDKPPQ